MDSALLIAIVTASFALAGSITASIIAAVASRNTQRGQAKNSEELIRLKNRLDADRRNDELRLSATAELENLREPLLAAAKDLANRIHNLRYKDFIYYIRSEDEYRREVALLGTLHRFAKYWTMQELLYSRTNLLRFETEADTVEVAGHIGAVARTFASDSAFGLNLIFWREEQRAVAEIMVEHGGTEDIPTVTGFATFRKRYREDLRKEAPEDLALWLERFAQDLQEPSVAQSPRLKELDDNLSLLIGALERGRIAQLAGQPLS